MNQCSLVDLRYRRSKFRSSSFSLRNHLHEQVRMRSKLCLKAQKQLYHNVQLTQISTPNIDSCILLFRVLWLARHFFFNLTSCSVAYVTSFFLTGELTGEVMICHIQIFSEHLIEGLYCFFQIKWLPSKGYQRDPCQRKCP